MELNHKIEREIRYLGSNDFAYMTRKMRGYEPAGVSVDEIIDDLSKLLKIQISNASTLEARIEIFSGSVIDKQFAKLPEERQREVLKNMNFDKHHIDVILKRIIDNKELLLSVILPILGKTIGPEVFQSIIISIIAQFIGLQSAKQILAQIVSKLPLGTAWLGPVVWGATAVWSIADLSGPASRKTIPLILYLGVLCLRDGQTEEFMENLHASSKN